MDEVKYALLYAKNAAQPVLFDEWAGNPWIAASQYYYAVDALRVLGVGFHITEPRVFGGDDLWRAGQ
jgi:hypothetical protein